MGVVPDEVTTDGAAAYSPALAAVIPPVAHETGKAVQQRIERDHQHLKGRLRPTRGFKTLAGARVLCRGHAFLCNLRSGFYYVSRQGKGDSHHVGAAGPLWFFPRQSRRRSRRRTPRGVRASDDGAKRRTGGDVHGAVDLLGYPLTLIVTAADAEDRVQAGALAIQIQVATGEAIEVARVA